MQHDRICTPAEEDAKTDQAILMRLLHEQGQWPWSVEELARDRGDELGTIDALGRLHAAGLVHQTSDGLVFPTRAAVYFEQIQL